MALRDVLTAAAIFPTTPVQTTAGLLPLRSVMVAIAGAENPGWGNRPGDAASNYPGQPEYARWACGGYTSFGTWQVNLRWNHDLVTQLSGATDPCAMAQWLSSYGNAARAALAVYQSQGLGAWTTYTGGQWLSHLHAVGTQAGAPVVTGTAVAAPAAAVPVDQAGAGAGGIGGVLGGLGLSPADVVIGVVVAKLVLTGLAAL